MGRCRSCIGGNFRPRPSQSSARFTVSLPIAASPSRRSRPHHWRTVGRGLGRPEKLRPLQLLNLCLEILSHSPTRPPRLPSHPARLLHPPSPLSPPRHARPPRQPRQPRPPPFPPRHPSPHPGILPTCLRNRLVWAPRHPRHPRPPRLPRPPQHSPTRLPRPELYRRCASRGRRRGRRRRRGLQRRRRLRRRH